MDGAPGTEYDAARKQLKRRCTACIADKSLVGAYRPAQSSWSSFVPDHTVPYGTVLSRDAFPGTSCQATMLRSVSSLRDAMADISRQHLAKACCELSRRDGAIVAWHEVPGKRHPQEPSRRVRCDRVIGVANPASRIARQTSPATAPASFQTLHGRKTPGNSSRHRDPPGNSIPAPTPGRPSQRLQ